MIQNNRPRYWVHWYDRWHLLLVLVLVLVLFLALWVSCNHPLHATQLNQASGTTVQLDRWKTIQGQAEPNSLVRIYANDKLLGETTTDVNGNFSFSLPALAAGAYQFKATAQVSGVPLESPAIAVNLVQPAPTINAAATTAALAANDQATATANLAAQDGANGTATANAAAQQSANATGTASAAAQSNSNATSTANAPATATAAGITATPTTTAPPATATPAATAGQPSPSPSPTMVAGAPVTPPTLEIEPRVVAPLQSLSGTAAPGATLHLLDGSKLLGETRADANGKWTLVLDPSIVTGDHSFVVVVVQGSQEQMRSQAKQVAVVQPLRILKPVGGELVAGAALPGTGAVGATITISANGKVLGTTTVHQNGFWSFPLPGDLPTGIVQFTAEQSDPKDSATVSINVAAALLPPTGDARVFERVRALSLLAVGVGLVLLGIVLLRRRA